MITSHRKHIIASVAAITLAVMVASVLAMLTGAAQLKIATLPKLPEWLATTEIGLVVVVLQLRPNGPIPAASLNAEKV